MKYLVCPGPGKSGTTLLHYLFTNNKDYAGPFQDKEYCYFRQDRDEKYKTIFNLDNLEKTPKSLFEFSPLYFSDVTLAKRKATADRVKKTVRNPLILFTIRHPIRRSISSYIHCLQDFSRFGRNRHVIQQRRLNDPYTMTFGQALRTDQNIGMLLSETIKYYAELFGEDRVVFFFLEEDVKDIQRFYDFISEKLNISAKGFLEANHVPRILSQKNMPRYYYSEKNDINIVTDEGEVTLPKGIFYIANDVEHEVIANMDPLTANTLMNAQKYWTNHFTPELQQRLFDDFFKEDLSETLGNLDASRSASPCPDYLSMPLSEKRVDYSKPDVGFLKSKLS